MASPVRPLLNHLARNWQRPVTIVPLRAGSCHEVRHFVTVGAISLEDGVGFRGKYVVCQNTDAKRMGAVDAGDLLLVGHDINLLGASLSPNGCDHPVAADDSP